MQVLVVVLVIGRISVGYLMSNLDIYSQMRHLSYEGISFEKFYPKRNFMQGAYLSCSYYF